jgi:hydrogenase nickel incorporation protein HypA/HybF
MHEASLIKDLIRKIEALAGAENAGRILNVDVRLGALCHMSEAHFREHFQQASAGTVAEGATLRVDARTDPTEDGAQDLILTAVEVS